MHMRTLRFESIVVHQTQRPQGLALRTPAEQRDPTGSCVMKPSLLCYREVQEYGRPGCLGGGGVGNVSAGFTTAVQLSFSPFCVHMWHVNRFWWGRVA